jgi:hypothetical protein
MSNLFNTYKALGKNKKFLVSTGVALFILFAGMVITFFAIVYATERASGPVTDVILSNIRVYDMDAIFIYGPVLFWAIVVVYLFFEPKKIPFTFKSIGLFLVIRSLFTSMTHMGPFPTHIPINASGLFGAFTSGNDLFFSGHTGLPFLMALVFWQTKSMRYFCLISSLIFGTVVLMTHLHYTIDVFGAFFITYTIFHIAQSIFVHDRKIFLGGLN